MFADSVLINLLKSPFFGAAVVAGYAPVFMESCRLEHLSGEQAESTHLSGAGNPELDQYTWGAVIAYGLNATFAMKNSTLADIRSEHAIRIEDTDVYSDNPAHTVRYRLSPL